MSEPPSDPTTKSEDRQRDPFESVVSAAFGPGPDTREFEDIPAVIQEILDPDSPPDLKASRGGPRSDASSLESPERGPLQSRYRILGRIARGGIGVVVRARDRDLDREVALKVLQKRHLTNSALVRRFYEEARIAGQLQHPGVVPVHALEQRSGGRPFFTMKLVQGETLAALLADRKDNGQDRRRFLVIFEKLCETLAYAHDKGVIHRDVKPLNIMVGTFGEVQVMDWGLAKVLGGSDERENDETGAETATISATRRYRQHSESGSVMGTPAYMAPEQARGEVDRVDERTDTFALGAILCEILTGSPPYVGKTSREVRLMAGEARLEDAMRRLDDCGADPDLVNLTLACLAPDRDQRPRNAGAVLEAVSTYLASVERRMRAAEVAEAEARARAAEERRARRLTVALGAAIIFAMLLAVGGYLWIQTDRISRREASLRTVNKAIDSAAFLHGQARATSGDDLQQWTRALAAAKNATALARSDDVDEETRRRARELLEAVTNEETAAKANRRMIQWLEEIDIDYAEHHDSSRKCTALEAAFGKFGLDLETLSPDEAASRIRDSDISEDLVATLETWADAGSRRHPERVVFWKRLIHIANTVNPDPWRMQLRDALLAKDPERLKTLVASKKTRSLPPKALYVLAWTLGHRGAVEEALILLRLAWQQYPDDYSINIGLAHFSYVHQDPPRLDEAIRYLTAAASIHPRGVMAWGSLAIALLKKEDYEGAAGAFREVIRLQPDSASGHVNLGFIHLRTNELDAALEAFRKGLDLEPDNGLIHYNLGVVLTRKGEIEGAFQEYQEAIRLKPDHPQAHNNLGLLKKHRGDLDGAIKAFWEAILINPDFIPAHGNLASALAKAGDVDGAATAYYDLGILLRKKGDIDGAVKAFRESIHRVSTRAEVWMDFGDALVRKNLLEKAVTCFERAQEVAPESPKLKKRAEERIRACRKKIEGRSR